MEQERPVIRSVSRLGCLNQTTTGDWTGPPPISTRPSVAVWANLDVASCRFPRFGHQWSTSSNWLKIVFPMYPTMMHDDSCNINNAHNNKDDCSCKLINEDKNSHHEDGGSGWHHHWQWHLAMLFQWQQWHMMSTTTSTTTEQGTWLRSWCTHLPASRCVLTSCSPLLTTHSPVWLHQELNTINTSSGPMARVFHWQCWPTRVSQHSLFSFFYSHPIISLLHSCSLFIQSCSLIWSHPSIVISLPYLFSFVHSHLSVLFCLCSFVHLSFHTHPSLLVCHPPLIHPFLFVLQHSFLHPHHSYFYIWKNNIIIIKIPYLTN